MTSSARTRKIGLTLVKITLTVLVLLAVAWKFDFLSALRLLSTVTWSTVAFCLAVLLCQAWIASVRFSVVVSLFGSRLSKAMAIRLTLEANFFNQASISFIGGDAFRIWRIHDEKVSLAQATSAIVLERVIGIITNHLVFVALLPFVIGRIENGAIQWSLAVLAGAGLGGIAIVIGLGFLGRRYALMNLLPMRWRTSRMALMLVELATIGRHILDNPPATWRIAALSAVLALMNCLAFYLILRNWDITAELALYCALLVPGMMEIVLLPVSVAGWGLREGVLILGFGAVGLPSEIGLASSAAYGFLLLFVGLLGGPLWFSDRSVK